MIVFREGMCRTSERTGEMMREQKDFRQTLGNTTTPRDRKNQARFCKKKFKAYQLQLHIYDILHFILFYFGHLKMSVPYFASSAWYFLSQNSNQ